jgi:hypothetical protein
MVLSRQQAMLDLQAIQRIPGLAGYWPADPAYLYQDSAGTIPASTNGTGVVGLRVDASKGLSTGASTVTNPDFLSGSSGWGASGVDGTHTITFSTGSVRYQSGATSPVLYLTQADAMTPGALNILTISVSASNGGNMSINNNGGYTSIDVSVGTRSVIFQAGAAETYLNFYRGKADQDATFTSIDIKPLLGKHAYQQTTSKKPILKRTPTSNVYWLNSDDDDELTATLGNLGSACTVAQAGAEGVTFTEGVTISSTYNIAPAFGFNGDVAIFNRALTTTEKALVTRYMSRGVPLLGSNLVTNGTFDTDLTGWSADAAFTWDSGAARAASTGYLSQTLSNAASPLGTQLCIQYSYASSTGRFRLNTGPISNLPLPATISGTSGTITYSGAKVNTNLVMQSMDANANLTTDNFSVRVNPMTTWTDRIPCSLPRIHAG